MPATSPINTLAGKPRDLKTMWVAGGAAGVLACPAGTIKATDEIISVARFTTATFAPGTDLSAEFSVNAADSIKNTGGTATTGQLLLVTYATRHPKY
jgi:hypothetical protein